VELLVNKPTTLDIQFTEVGGVSEIVSVEAEAAQINTVDASIGNAMGTRPITQLPFNARNVVNLLSLQPGVAYSRDTPVPDPDDTRHGSVNGGRSDQANVTLDGVDVNDQQNGYAFTSVLRMTLDWSPRAAPTISMGPFMSTIGTRRLRLMIFSITRLVSNATSSTETFLAVPSAVRSRRTGSSFSLTMRAVLTEMKIQRSGWFPRKPFVKVFSATFGRMVPLVPSGHRKSRRVWIRWELVQIPMYWTIFANTRCRTTIP